MRRSDMAEEEERRALLAAQGRPQDSHTQEHDNTPRNPGQPAERTPIGQPKDEPRTTQNLKAAVDLLP